MNYIKECPFCGSNNLKHDAESYNGLIDSRLYVECKNCESRMYTYGKTLQEAIDRYNREMVGGR